MDLSFDTNNLLEMALEIQMAIYFDSIDEDSLEYSYFIAINDILHDYLKYGIRCNELINLCIDIRLALNL